MSTTPEPTRAALDLDAARAERAERAEHERSAGNDAAAEAARAP